MISPLELKNKEFAVSWRGYDKHDVDDFIRLFIGDYETLYRFHKKATEAADPAAPEIADPIGRDPQTQTGKQIPGADFGKQQAYPQASERNPAEWEDAGRNIRDILAMAQKAAEDARIAAASKADAMIAEAAAEASRITAQAEEKVIAAQRRLGDLSAQEASLRARMRGFLVTYRQMVDDFEETAAIDYSLKG